jgi:hypothetical protein
VGTIGFSVKVEPSPNPPDGSRLPRRWGRTPIRLESNEQGRTSRAERAVADFYSLVHCDAGLLETFETREDAERELARVLMDKPTWVYDLWIEPFELGEDDR